MSDEQQQQIITLGKALDTQANTIKNLENKLKDAKQMGVLFEVEKKSWQQAKVLQDKIIQQQLLSSDDKVRELQDELMKLKSVITDLKAQIAILKAEAIECSV